MDAKSLILGFLLGIIFIFLLLGITIFIINRNFLKKSIKANQIDNKEIRNLIKSKQKQIIKSYKVGLNNNFNLVQDLTKDLVLEVAEYYYPNSKYPHLEISIIEAIDMTERVTERLKEILDFKAIGLLKNIRISQIIYILETKKNIENNSFYKISKKYRLDKVISYGYTALNFTNPSYWLKRITFTSTLETTLRSVAVMTLNIVGEESSRLYSKKILDNTDKILEKEFEKFAKEIEMGVS